MKVKQLLWLLVLSFLFSISSVMAATIEVSQPIALTSNPNYERGESIAKDSLGNFWLFYGRSASVTGHYGNSNPDISDYQIYYKKASSVSGLEAAAANAVTNADNIYQGQTSSVYYDGKIWVFAADETLADNSIKAWHTTDGLSWTEHDTGFDGSGSPHLWAAVYDGKIFLVYNAPGNKLQVRTYDGVSWSAAVDASTNEGMPRLYVDSSNDLYLVWTSWGTPAFYIHRYNSSWSTTPDYSISGTIYDDSDPFLTQLNGGTGDYALFFAPWDSANSRQFIDVWTADTVANLGPLGTEKTVTNGGNGITNMVDMWPVVLNDNGKSYLFLNMERDANDPSIRDTGNIWYFDLDWDTNNNHYDYIQPAIDAANPTDTINVSDGTYTESININKSLTLTGTGYSSTTVIDTSGFSAINITADNVIINGFDIKFFGTHAIMIKEADFVTINNSRINTTVDGSLGIWICGSNNGCIPSNNLVVENNVIIINGKSTGIYADNSNPAHSNFYIRNNVFEAPNLGVNVELYDVNNTFVTGNTFGKSGSVSLVYSSEGSDVSNVKVFNNTFLGNGNVSGVTPTIWVESDFISGDGSSSVTNVDISRNTFTGWENGAILFGEDSSTNFNDISGNLFVNYNYFNSGSGFALKSNTTTHVNAENNWWGACNGPSGDAPGSGFAALGDIDFTPWIGICIENKTDVTCKYETNNITLEANLTSLLNINKVWMTYTIDGTNHNKTASNTQGDIYSAVINSAELVGGQNITWNVYANDTFGNVFSNGMKIFYVINRTSLVVDPFAPNGLNNWYVTEPLFSLIKDPTGGNMFYQWDSDDIYTYTVPFGLENIPNAPPIESAGTLELNWWTDFGVCGNEPINTELFYVDLKNPEITDLKPENNSVVYNNLKPKISAYLDDVYQSNSGIDTEIVQMSLNGNMVIPTVNTTDTLDAIVSYTPTADLDTGKHNVTVNVTDVAGRSTESTWFFEINITPVFSMVIHSPQNDVVYGSRRVPFNITSSENLELMEYIDWSLTTPRWRKLCDDCDEYGSTREKTISFSEGEHIVTIRATDYKDQIAEINVSFSVDGRSPRILKTLPRRNKFTNGSDFYIKYTEANLKEVSVTFNPTIVLADCTESGVNKECTIDLNSELIPFDNQTITYWFNVSDDVRSVMSRKIDVHVDTTKPVLNNPDSFYTIDGRYVEFNMSITEDNLDRVEYIDYEESNPEFRTLCSRLKDNLCEKKVSFKKGNHALDVSVKDEAGNSIIMEGIEFEV